jgi:hypothetical protein
LPSAASYKSFTVQVIDGISDTDCTVGGATGTSAHNALCSAQWNGSAYVWVPVASGVQEVDTDTTSGISGGPITDTGTIHCEQSSSSQFGCAKPDGTSITSTGGVYSASLTGSLEIQPPAAPIGGQYVFVPASAGADSMTLSLGTGGSFEIDDSMTLGPPVLPSYIDPANVTAIYAVGLYTEVNYFAYNGILNAPGFAASVTFNCGGQNLLSSSVVLTTLTGATFGTSTCFAKLAANYSGGAFMNVSLAGYYVYYTGTAPPADNTVKVVSPLYYNASTKQLGLTWPFDGASDTGTTNALAVTIPAGTPSMWSEVKVSAAHANTSTTPTLNVNGTGGITIKGPTGGALVAGDISTTVVARFIKNLDGYWILENPQVSGGGGTTTNALTAAATGGAAPGTTFNGSAPVTFDYHSFSADCALTLTTTGTSGAATLGPCSGGTHALNIPQYTGGGGGGTPGGSSGQFQYNAAGSFAGSTYTYYAQSGDTISSIEALCGVGNVLYVVDIAQTFTLGASHALNACVTVKFNPQGSWTVNGSTFTLSNVRVDSSSSLNTHFIAGTGSLTLANGFPSQVPIEWAGGVNDGNVTANTGTDNTAAWNLIYPMVSNGTVMFQCGQYRFSAAGPAITKSNLSLGTTCSYATQSDSTQSEIFTSSASATVVSFTGASVASPINGNALTGLSIVRAVTPATGSIGVQAHNAFGFLARFNKVWDSSIGWDINYAPSDVTGGFYNNGVADGYVTAQGVGPYIAWNLIGSSSGFQSMTGQSNGVDFNTSVINSATTYGMQITGKLWDLDWDSFNVARPDYGIYISSATMGQDAHFTRSTLDSCAVDCLYVSGLVGNTVDFRGGWMTAANVGQTAGAELISSSGITLDGIQFYENQQVPAIYNHGVAAGVNTITNNKFWLTSGGKQSIYSNAGTTLAISGNTIDGNGFNYGGTVPQIQFVGQSNSSVQSNWIGNGTGIGIGFDATSNNNCCANLNKLQTFTISDAGTGNELTPTTAWGTITGTLSAQTDLNTALGLKAPLASPALTGTPTVPTAAPGTNTTQAASTAFVQAAVTGGTLPPQAADTVVMNATGSSAVPSAVAMPTCTSGADLYNTTTHTWSCVSGGSGDFVKIAQVVTSGSATSMSFTSIPGTYSNLELRCNGRSAASSTTDFLKVVFNSDTGNNYQDIFADSLTSTTTTTTSVARGFAFGGNFAAATSAVNSSGSTQTLINNYANTTFTKILVTNSGNMVNSFPGTGAIEKIGISSTWNSTAAITRIDVSLGSGLAFVNNSTCTLYGLN